MSKIVNKIAEPQPEGNAGCIVKKEGHILVVKLRETGKWDIPAGKPLPHETAPETAQRETWEESGVSVKIIRLLTFIGAPKEQGLYIYEATPLNKALPLNIPLQVNSRFRQEIIEARLLPIDNLNENNFRYPAILPEVIALFDTLD